MRTTIDLPDDLHRAAMQIARDRHQTLSRTVASLLRSALAGGGGGEVAVDPDSGLPVLRVGSPITGEHVASVDDDA